MAPDPAAERARVGPAALQAAPRPGEAAGLPPPPAPDPRPGAAEALRTSRRAVASSAALGEQSRLQLTASLAACDLSRRLLAALAEVEDREGARRLGGG